MRIDSGHAAELTRLRLKRDRTQVAIEKTRCDRGDLPVFTACACHFVGQAPVQRDAIGVRDREQTAWMTDGHDG